MMFSIITMLLSTLGATGMGSLLKIFGGIVDRWGAAKEAREKRKMMATLRSQKISTDLYAQIFAGDSEGAKWSRATRRMLALIGMMNMFVISVICIIWPDVPLITFTMPEYREGVRLLWGLVEFPSSTAITTVITTGHITLMTMTILASVIGFYFCPGGRK